MHGVIKNSGYCLDNDRDIRLMNDYDISPEAQYLNVRVKRCQANDCMKEEEID